MYLFFLIFFILVSVFLIFFILSQPGKGFNNTTYLSAQNNLNLFSNTNRHGFTTNLIYFLAGFFLLISIILCNINNTRIKKDFFWKDDKKNITVHQNTLNIQKNEIKH